MAVAELGYVPGADRWPRSALAAEQLRGPPLPAGGHRQVPEEVVRRRTCPDRRRSVPGVPARGRGAAIRADASWLPIASGLTPHGLRHTYRTLMDELGTPKKLMDMQMGHEDRSIGARYAHVTTTMVGRLVTGLTEAWQDALDARLRLSPGSAVAVLDRLLAARREEDGR